MKPTKRQQEILDEISRSGIELPATEAQLRKFRGVGNETLKWLHSKGMVRTVTNNGLGVRAESALHDLGITDTIGARDAILSGRLAVGKKRNYGHSTHIEICKWAGLPVPRKSVQAIIAKQQKKHVKVCPTCRRPI